MVKIQNHFIHKWIKATVFHWRLERAIKKAQRDAALHRRKFLVVVLNGKPVVVSAKGMKKLIAQHRFRKGFTYARMCECAAYIANPPKI